jgi:hypothetical protein
MPRNLIFLFQIKIYLHQSFYFSPRTIIISSILSQKLFLEVRYCVKDYVEVLTKLDIMEKQLVCIPVG